MQSAEKNHPGERFFIRRDAISGGESSLGEIFIRRDEISGKESSRKRIPIRRDAIGEEESSLEENSYPQG